MKAIRIGAVLAISVLVLSACSGPDNRASVTEQASDVPSVTATNSDVAGATVTRTATIVVTPEPLATTSGTGAAEAPSVDPSQTPADLSTAEPSTPTPVDLAELALSLEPVGMDFSQPVLVTHAGDANGRIFILEKTGTVRLLDGTLYLDISDRVLFYELRTQEHELGLVGLAFHPQFVDNGWLYVHYTNKQQQHIIARFTQGANGVADAGSEQILLTYPQPEINFFGGTIAFGRDGYLYIAMGTGTSVDSDQVVAQELDNLYGKLLRIDVDGEEPYGIPPDNPFVATPDARPEIWAYGLRNPWRFAFDRTTNDLYIGGPGEFQKEWINYVAGGNAAGRNFGWPIIEGDVCWEAAILPCDMAGLEEPVVVYERADGNCVVIGGTVYREAADTASQGVYV